jgi:hypothetical protein
MNYAEASALLQRGRGGQEWRRRKLKNNTYLERVNKDGTIGVLLHNTHVVTFSPDGKVTLNTDGWRTVTTKDRINDYLPEGWGLYQDSKVWYLYPPDEPTQEEKASHDWRSQWERRQARRVVFEDGLAILPDGSVTGAGSEPDPKLLRQITNYAKGYANAFIAGKVPKPSGGDCWGCLFEKTLHSAPTPQADGEPVVGFFTSDGGQRFGNMGTSHLLSHLEERYYVPSMLNNARREFPGHFPPAAQWVIAAYWQEEWTPEGVKERLGSFVEFAREQIRKTIRWYLLRAFGYAR